jgi:hypothetical protein
LSRELEAGFGPNSLGIVAVSGVSPFSLMSSIASSLNSFLFAFVTFYIDFSMSCIGSFDVAASV